MLRDKPGRKYRPTCPTPLPRGSVHLRGIKGRVSVYGSSGNPDEVIADDKTIFAAIRAFNHSERNDFRKLPRSPQICSPCGVLHFFSPLYSLRCVETLVVLGQQCACPRWLFVLFQLRLHLSCSLGASFSHQLYSTQHGPICIAPN